MANNIDDPIKEADIYQAYGRLSEAISILKTAIAREPNRSALRVKLAELEQKSRLLLADQRTKGRTNRISEIQSLQEVRKEHRQTDLKALRREAEALHDPLDRTQALAGLAELGRADSELDCLLAEQEPRLLQQHRERRVGLFVMLPVVIVAAYFFVSKLVVGEMPNIFLQDAPYLSWDHDPYIFVFVVGFIGVVLFVLACAAIGITRFGPRISRVSTPNKALQPTPTNGAPER